MDILRDYFSPAIISLITVALVVAVLSLGNLLLNRVKRDEPDLSIQRQITKLLLFLAGAVTIIVSLPISQALRGQILSFLGLLVSAAIALSSTTFLGNIMAGIMLRVISPFRVGDFVHINKTLGRVTGNSMFHLEVQSEDRNLITLPNLYVVTHHIEVFPPTGTVVSAEVSLGYDVPRLAIEQSLLAAATEAGLEAPFVLITSLGDYAITYRTSGLLRDVPQLLSARSSLRACILDALHEKNIEIVSPSFMNQRPVGEKLFIPPKTYTPRRSLKDQGGEQVIFDKADKAQELENMRRLLQETEEKIRLRESQLAAAVYEHEREAITHDVRSKKAIRKHLQDQLEALTKELDIISRGEHK